MTRFSFGALGALARAAIVVATALVAGCGSGAVSGPPVAPVVGPLTITPSTATLYSETPTSFIVTGGNGEYVVISSDQSALPIASVFTGGNVVTLIPNPVAADTPVTLTVRDTGTSAPVTATLTVKPRTVSNTLTITPATAACQSAVCSGSDAEIKVSLIQNGIPLRNRQVRFDVVSGNFAIITSPPGTPEITALSGTAVTDDSGNARMRIRAAAGAPSQTALIQVTDLGSGSFQRASFVIVQSTGPSEGFFLTPASFTFQGGLQGQCANGSLSADIYIFGGSPPYTVSNSLPDAFTVFPTTLQTPGSHFTVTPRNASICIAAPGAPIIVRDSAGHTATATVASIEGTQTLPALAVAPGTVTLTSCSDSGTIAITGGTGGPYSVTLDNNSPIEIRGSSANAISLGRRSLSSSAPASLQLAVTDGRSTAPFTVAFDVGARGACP